MTSRDLFQFEENNKKVSALLVPVFALRHPKDFGIGDTTAVKDAIDFCQRMGFAILQMLPIHECVGDFSPYNAITSQALSPALLTITPREVPGLKQEDMDKECSASWLEELRKGPVKYQSVQPLKIKLLQQAYQNFLQESHPENKSFQQFQDERSSWLPAYTLFRLLIDEYAGNTEWGQWKPEHRSMKAAESWLAQHPKNTDLIQRRQGYAFIQWIAWRQWLDVRRHSDEKGVLLMGEMSYGVSRNSADVWQHEELFDLEWSVGSQPSNYFDTNKDSEKWGQNWGLPFYRWENHRSDEFKWLRRRLEGESQFFHICRLDHLRGYFRAYMFPWPGGPKHTEFAKLGPEEIKLKTGGKLPRFVPGPDNDEAAAAMNSLQARELIGVMREASGEMYLIAELMGILPPYMRQALEELKMPNLTFPQLEKNEDRSLPGVETFRPLSLATYANHDHAPLAAYYVHLHENAKEAPEGPSALDLKALLASVGWTDAAPDNLTEAVWQALLRRLFQSPCQVAALMSSDLLATTQRFNLPGSYGAETWNERLELPLTAYFQHPTYAPRLNFVHDLIQETQRAP